MRDIKTVLFLLYALFHLYTEKGKCNILFQRNMGVCTNCHFSTISMIRKSLYHQNRNAQGHKGLQFNPYYTQIILRLEYIQSKFNHHILLKIVSYYCYFSPIFISTFKINAPMFILGIKSLSLDLSHCTAHIYTHIHTPSISYIFFMKAI